MKAKDVKKIKKGLTHGSKFHSDDVFSAAFLQIINPEIEIIRSNVVFDDFEGIVFDIGMGKFDHHMKDNEKRNNGIPYASFGKLWREFACELYGEEVYNNIDKKLIADLDLSDNTGSYNALAFAISMFNPVDDGENGDEEFKKAVGFAKIILSNMIKKELKHLEDTEKVKKYYNEATDKRIIVLDEYLYTDDYLPYTEAIYVIYPSNRGGFAGKGVPINSDTVKLKKPFPEKWVENLPPYLEFCHTSRFLIKAKSLNDILYACREALK